MKLYLKLLRWSNVIIFGMVGNSLLGQDTTSRGNEMSLRAQVHFPLLNIYNLEASNNSGTGTSNFNAKSHFTAFPSIAITLKNRHSLLFDLSIQYCRFDFVGPVYYVNNSQLHNNQYIPYYEEYNYGQIRTSFGIGKEISRDRINMFGFLGGLSLYLGDQGEFFDKSYSGSGTFLGSGSVGISNLRALAPYVACLYWRNLSPRVGVLGEINYSFIPYQGQGYFQYPYYVLYQSVLSFGVGIRFKVIKEH